MKVIVCVQQKLCKNHREYRKFQNFVFGNYNNLFSFFCFVVIIKFLNILLITKFSKTYFYRTHVKISNYQNQI